MVSAGLKAIVHHSSLYLFTPLFSRYKRPRELANKLSVRFFSHLSSLLYYHIFLHLARATIHHTEITERYNQHWFFVACDSAATQVELAALIGAHVGLKPGKDLTHPVIQYFSSSSKSLLILDNLETLWEPVESRGKIEEFLSLLTSVDHLALVVGVKDFTPVL
jgi:hypothetical protein